MTTITREQEVIARQLIAQCEKDLHRTLPDGERRDLLMDNTTWDRNTIAAVVAAIVCAI